MNKLFSRITSGFLAMIMLFSLMPSVYAGSGGKGGEGAEDGIWRLTDGSHSGTEEYAGMRFSLYFAEGDWADLAEAEAATATVDFQQVGNVIDIIQTGKASDITHYTRGSVYDYMHELSDLNSYTLVKSKIEPFSNYATPSENMGFNTSGVFNSSKTTYLKGFPDIFTETPDEDRYMKFFTGLPLKDLAPQNSSEEEKLRIGENWLNKTDFHNTMKVIDKILEGTNTKITEEDFKMGWLTDSTGKKKQGIYKLYFEPTMKMRHKWKSGYLATARDAIAMERGGFKFPGGVDWNNGKGQTGTYYNIFQIFTTAVRNVGNAVYMSAPQPNIHMTYRIAKFEREVHPQDYKDNSDYVNSAGVGVITGFPKGGREGPKLIRTYVEVVGLDENDEPIYKTVAESDITNIEFARDNKGFITKIPVNIDVVDYENPKGEAYLNDIIVVTPEKVTLNANGNKTVWENTDLPQNVLEPGAFIDKTNTRTQLEPKATDIPAYRFAIFTGKKMYIETLKQTDKVDGISFKTDSWGVLGKIASAYNSLVKEGAEFSDGSHYIDLDFLYEEQLKNGAKIDYDTAKSLTLDTKIEPKMIGSNVEIAMGVKNKEKTKIEVISRELLENLFSQPAEVVISTEEEEMIPYLEKEKKYIESSADGMSKKDSDIVLDAFSKVLSPNNHIIVRYILKPKAKQYNLIEVYNTATQTKTYIEADAVNLDLTVNKDTKEATARITKPEIDVLNELKMDGKTQVSELEIREWVTNMDKPNPYFKDGNLPEMSKDGKKGTTLEEIPNYPIEPLNHDLYVKWYVEITPPPYNPGKYEVPQWRLSRYWNAYDAINGIPISIASMSIPGYSRGHCLQVNLTQIPWRFKLINPNGQFTLAGKLPANLKLENWIHSETVMPPAGCGNTVGNSFTAQSLLSANVTGIKSTDTSGINLVDWVEKNKLGGYDINNAHIPGRVQENYEKSRVILPNTYNIDTYLNMFNRYAYATKNGHVDYGPYVEGLGPGSAVNLPAPIPVRINFSRYNQKDTEKFVTTPEIKSDNMYSTVKYQSQETLKVYPEYGMLFTSDTGKGDNSIKWAISDKSREINPVIYQTFEHKVFVNPVSSGSSVATDTRAITQANKVTDGRGLQVIHKGAAVNSNFKIQRAGVDLPNKPKLTNQSGMLTVKTYALDFKNDENRNKFVGSSGWNPSYDSYKAHNQVTSSIASNKKAKATEKLLVDSQYNGSLDYTGAIKTQNTKDYEVIKYKSSSNYKNVGEETIYFEHELIIRGGHLIGVRVDNHSGKKELLTIEKLKAESVGDESYKSIYEAILAMNLYDESNNKANTIFKSFEHLAENSHMLSEELYATELQKERKAVDGIDTPEYAAVKKGAYWYSEDSTILVIREYITNYRVPSISFSDKMAMTVKNLQTPANKAQFYSQMGSGYTWLRYDLEVPYSKTPELSSKTVSVYFEYDGFKEHRLGEKNNNGLNKPTYIIPNVSITDTMRNN